VTAPRRIFFASDFGVEDAYVGIVEAVMATIAPAARVIHLGHGIPPQDLRRGAYQLFEAVPYLPEGSVVLAVVDPGVGSARRAVAVEAERHLYVAPDNGLLAWALAVDPPRRAVSLENPKYRLPPSGHTFHGRDVFGPAAACLAQGLALDELGPELPLDRLVTMDAGIVAGDHGQVWTFDRFGNAITNLRAPEGAWSGVRVGGREVPAASHYAAVAPGAALALAGSGGMVEVSVRDGAARQLLGLAAGQPIEILR
jgi:S-adenosyl-L-methionine hydrolase (adenosine-forming)